MKTQVVYSDSKARIICITEKDKSKHYAMLDNSGRFVRELPCDFCVVGYIKSKKKKGI